jgi:predicted DNA-binding mobile mystery protein A
MASTGGGPEGRRAARRALDRRLPRLRAAANACAVPKGGWIRAIREALGMTAADLGARMGLAETSVLSQESSERQHRIRLSSLEKAANALDCDVVYALVPRGPLERVVQERARQVAASRLDAVGHSMLLEDQQVGPGAGADQLEDEARALIDAPDLWRAEQG